MGMTTDPVAFLSAGGAGLGAGCITGQDIRVDRKVARGV